MTKIDPEARIYMHTAHLYVMDLVGSSSTCTQKGRDNNILPKIKKNGWIELTSIILYRPLHIL